MHKLIHLLFGLLLLTMMQGALAAKRLGPPIEQLQSEPERIRIVIAEAKAKTEPNLVLFSISDRLSGEAPDEVLLRTTEGAFTDVVAGRSYVVAFSYLRRNRRVIGGWEEDPAGPFTVEILGLGSTAVFEDTPDTRFLFSPSITSDPGGPGKQVDALLAQMQRADSRTRGLVVTELYLRPDLTEVMTPAQSEVLKQVFQEQALDPQHRDFLVRSALRLPPELTSPWLAEELRKIITLNGSQYDLSSFVPGLVRTAARGLQQTGSPSDVDLLSILLYSNNPGVAEAALDAMNQLDAAAALAKARQALKRGWIHGESRRVLVQYLGRNG